MAGIEYCIGAIALFFIFAFVFYSRQERIAARESAKDAEFVLKELDISAHRAVGRSALEKIAETPARFFGSARTYWIGSRTHYFNVIRFTLYERMPFPIALQIFALSRDAVLDWKADKSASGAALAQFERDAEKGMERILIFAKTGDGDFEILFSKTSDIMRLRGGMLSASFNGKALGSVNLTVDGIINDGKNRTIGKAERDLTGMRMTIHGNDFRVPGPFFVESSFRLVEPTDNLAKLTADERRLLFSIALFNQAYWRGRLPVPVMR